MDRRLAAMATYRNSLLLLAPVLAAFPAWGDTADPTRPPVLPPATQTTTAQEQQVEWALTIVKSSPSHSAAVLNGKVVYVGDKVGSATVVEILPSAVVMEEGGRRFEVTLGAWPVKAAAAERRRASLPVDSLEIAK